MDLVRSALAALATWVAGSLLVAAVFTIWVEPSQLRSLIGQVLWVAIPQFLVGLMMSAAAAYAHRRPEREDRRRHGLAVLIPAIGLVFVQALLNVLEAAEILATITAIVAESAGVVVGWLLISRVVRRQEHTESAGGGYF